MQNEWWDRLGTFWERSTGGGDVAARPTEPTNANWPTVPRAAGIDEAISWLEEGFEIDGLARFVFLIGGPGAGKSHAASGLARPLKLKDPVSPLALRAYRYETSTRDLFLVNDATISSKEFAIAPLSHEIESSLGAGDHFFACVNRGVLVEEIAQQGRSIPVDTSGATIVRWLQETSNSLASGTQRSGWDIETVDAGSYLRAGRLFFADDEVAELLAVYVDVNSLLEASPSVSLIADPIFTVRAEPYTVAEFELRREASSAVSPAGTLFAEVFEKIEIPDHAYSNYADPFAANLVSLRSDIVRKGVLSILRAAEITSSQRMTFREVWGALSRCLIGGANSRFASSELEAFTASQQPLDEDRTEVAFAKLRILADFRFSQALFGSSSESAIVFRDPVLRLTHLSDPVRDAVPGFLADGSDLGWASSISDAFSGDAGGSSPLDALLNRNDGGVAFVAAVTSFDRQLDSSYISLMLDSTASTELRRDATSWYGSYLTRLFAVSAGIPAFRREVSAWTVAHVMAPGIPAGLENQLTTLLKPVRYPDRPGGEPLFPIFESRTNPIRGDESVATLAIRSRNPRIRTLAKSDSLFVVVEEVERPNVKMLLDFAMMREAMACADGFEGATELSETTSPRLERFRATRLVPGVRMDASNYRVVMNTSDVPLKVDEKA